MTDHAIARLCEQSLQVGEDILAELEKATSGISVPDEDPMKTVFGLLEQTKATTGEKLDQLVKFYFDLRGTTDESVKKQKIEEIKQKLAS